MFFAFWNAAFPEKPDDVIWRHWFCSAPKEVIFRVSKSSRFPFHVIVFSSMLCCFPFMPRKYFREPDRQGGCGRVRGGGRVVVWDMRVGVGGQCFRGVFFGFQSTKLLFNIQRNRSGNQKFQMRHFSNGVPAKSFAIWLRSNTF